MSAHPAAKEDRSGGDPSQTPHRLLDITVLMGGPSAERAVSLMSGERVATGLARRGHRVHRCDIHPQDVSALDREGADVVWIALHGQFGESGEVQQLCEDRGVPYTGSGPQASRVAMDKRASKRLFRQAGLSTPREVVVDSRSASGEVRRRLEGLGIPAVCKPVDGGSSVDITIARSQPQRDEAVAALLETYGQAMVEQYVEGREVTVGVLGERALPLLEIRPAGEFYDYHAKYDDDAGTEYVLDHGLVEDVVQACRRAALGAHRALGCRDMSRVDMIIDREGTPQVFEVNTIPGFTTHSLLPMAAQRGGIGFDELVERIAMMALARSFTESDPSVR